MMNIAISINKKYVNYAIVMLTSLCKNNDEHIDLYLLHSELDKKDFEQFENALTNFDIGVIPLKIDNSMLPPEAPATEQWSLEIYYRLFLTEILPDSVDRILYLDCDIIINKNIKDFYNSDFQNAHLIVCRDANNTRNQFTETESEMFKNIYSNPNDYFNSGVLLMNIDTMRNDNICFHTYFEVMNKYGFDLKMPDQDLLNFVHAGKIKYEDYRKYNLFAIIASRTGVEYEWAAEHTAIIHFAEGKPWNIADHIHTPFENIWWDYAKMTPCYQDLLNNYLETFDAKFTAIEKDIYSHELLFIKYVNNYVVLSKGVPEERLNALAEKYNKDGNVVKVLNTFDDHHNDKKAGNAFSASPALQKLSDSFHSISDDEKILFINSSPELNSYINRNKTWLYQLGTATEALMYTVQELL